VSGPVERIRAAVEVAQEIQGIDGRELLADPVTTPDPAVARMRDRLQRRRQRSTLRHQHRAARRRERAADFDAEMGDRGKRALRARQLATSPARRAANLQRLQAAVVAVALPVIIALGSASTSAVHAFMVTYAAASATVAWAVEPGIITLVSGIIIVRALMRINGAVPPPTLAWIERGALASSVVMCAFGSGPGAVVAPVGVAVVALAVERIITGIAAADLGTAEPVLLDEDQGDRAEADRAPAARLRAPFPPAWVAVDARRQVRVGGERAEGRLTPGTRALLPVRCAARAQVQDAHARGDAAMTALRGWDADSARMRIAPAHPDAPTPPRVRAPRVQDDQPGPAPAHTDAHADAPQEKQDARPGPVDAWITEQAARGMRDIEEHMNRGGDDDGQGDARPAPAPEPPAPTGAVRAARTRGEAARARILAHLDAHPGASAEEVGEAVGLSASQVRRHLRIIAGK
jgi:hypothetical protein